MIENTDTLIRDYSVKLIMEFGASKAKLEAIESIIRHMEYQSDAIKAIKCVLGMIYEEEEKE